MSSPDHNPETGTARLVWDENGQPISARYGDVYFSRHNGLAETRYVFLTQNHLADRWQAGFEQRTFYIGETGFGSGLNFLAAWQLWDQSPVLGKQLHFVSVENEPLGKQDLQRALALWPELADYASELLAEYPRRLMPGFHRFTFARERIILTLIVADASAGLNQLLVSDHPHFRLPFHSGMQAWFLDGFAPAKNPDMWQPALFDVIAALSAPGCTLATFTAAGLVKRELQRVGFRIEKRAGYGRKRDMLTAEYSGQESAPAKKLVTSTRNSPYPVPWHVPSHSVTGAMPSDKQAVVIGAGLAGSHSARALAERGWQVTVLEQAAEIASGASGNAQGVVYGKLSSDEDPLARFNLASLLFAQRLYRQYWGMSGIGEQCGTLLLGFDDSERRIQKKLRTQLQDAEDFLRFVDARQATELAGVPVDHSALFFPQLGWLRPGQLCRALLDHSNIQLRCNARVHSLNLDPVSRHWQLADKHRQTIATAPAVVIANACDARALAQSAHLPLKNIRGQVSHFAGEQLPLRTVICGAGYIAPAATIGAERLQSFGATFTLKEQRPEVLEADHRQNLAKLSASLPSAGSALHNLDVAELSGRAAFRCTTPDYLPLVGPVPDFTAFVDTYRLLGKNARAGIPLAGPYLPGLYVNVGHGSRGLAYTPLASAMMAAQMDGDLLPVPRNLALALNPARFIIRDLIRRRLP